ncbi:hypothetical protein T310_2710 [Rasamsonia emersonii CBS 393.64]|uniref:Uncharacterized protein n=1 Tax=Rasamsonia emersonii (strain ATCC 16479 / CBS 393.64 / IMI 116815) TaxID=1408163 RepID=A0A0F4YYX2_RASE3|nr:hypothetical protein T310_2710 [Rasamsonia emersonii CBS 393.64]KKA23285.1 hypothetical protein T310_2710 [Rasamsonia emersonii CBS 393.64]
MAQRDALNAGLPSLIRDYRIPPEARHKYNKFSDLKIFLEERFKKFVEHGASQYVAIQEFSLDDLEEMERKGLRRQLPRFRALTDDKDKIMIAKLAGVHHGTFQVVSQKEPDGSFKPMTRTQAVDYPSWVVEIGDSERLAQLRLRDGAIVPLPGTPAVLLLNHGMLEKFRNSLTITTPSRLRVLHHCSYQLITSSTMSQAIYHLESSPSASREYSILAVGSFSR